MRAHALKPSALPQKLKSFSGVGKCSKDFKCGIFFVEIAVGL